MKYPKPIQHPLLTNKHTKVFFDGRLKNGVPHDFIVTKTENGGLFKEESTLAKIHFQEGPVNEAGVNGVSNEDLIAMVITRLEYFNRTDFRCKENAMAVNKLEEALLWLRKRTMEREQRGVEGTNRV